MNRKNAARVSNPVDATVRLVGKVRREVKRTIKNSDAEQVHNLRVGIRRVRQCLDVFHEVLPKRTVRKARKKLAGILDEASPVRDIDVVRELMKSLHVRLSAPLSRKLTKERARFQRKLEKSLSKFERRDPAKEWVSHIEEESGDQPAPGFAALPALAEEYFKEGDLAAERSTPVKKLHRFRLKTKKFRYTLELYEDSLSSDLKAKLSTLREMQDHLGAISDCLRTMELLDDFRKADKEAVDRAIKTIRPQIQKHAAGFRRQWKKVFRPEDQRAWVAFLRHEDAPPVERRPTDKVVQMSPEKSHTA